MNYKGQNCFFEVKELRKKSAEPAEFESVYIDPYSDLRTKIKKAKEKYKEFKGHCCSLVVFNVDDWQARLDPLTVLGAMLGNLGFAMDINVVEGEAVEGSGRNVFLDGGKMVNYKRKTPHNTTINTIIVLEEIRDDSDIQKAIKEKIKKQGKPLTPEENYAVAHEVVIKEHHNSKRVIRVRIIENPFARKPLPAGLFNGPFDERWRYEKSILKRVIAGDKLLELEALKKPIEEL